MKTLDVKSEKEAEAKVMNNLPKECVKMIALEAIRRERQIYKAIRDLHKED